MIKEEEESSHSCGGIHHHSSDEQQHTNHHHLMMEHDHSSMGGFHFSSKANLFIPGLDIGPDYFSFTFGLVCIVILGMIRMELLVLSEDEAQSLHTRTVLYFIQASLSYGLMLVTMTFNVPLFFAVILGLTLGYRRNLIRKINKSSGDCCA